MSFDFDTSGLSWPLAIASIICAIGYWLIAQKGDAATPEQKSLLDFFSGFLTTRFGIFGAAAIAILRGKDVAGLASTALAKAAQWLANQLPPPEAPKPPTDAPEAPK